MSLYLSEWLEGPLQFYDFAANAWSPKIYCEVKKENTNYITAVLALVDIKGLEQFSKEIPPNIRTEFINRLKVSMGLVTLSIGIDKLLNDKVHLIYKETNYNLDETSEILSELIDRYILEYEFWNKVDLLDVLTNLIFYGTPIDPKPFVMILPPMSEWDDY